MKKWLPVTLLILLMVKLAVGQPIGGGPIGGGSGGGISACSDCAADFEAAGAVATHTADTTAVHGFSIQADCSGITSGFCLDSDDGILYSWDGDSVEVVAALSADSIAAAITSTGAAAILDVADSVTAGDSYTHFSTSADDDTVDELMAAIDTAFGVRCLESVFGTALEADDLGLSGTTLQLAAEVPHTDATETITGAWTLPNEKYTILTAVPGSPVTGVMYCFDNDTADPCDVAGTDDYCAFYDGADWVADHKTNGTKFFQSIPTPTLAASELNDNSDPHTLTADELKNTILTNSESTGADEWDFPARTEGWNFIFIKEADQNVTLDPNGTENWYFRTTNAAYTANGAGTSIVNTTAGKSTLTCFSTESAVFCTGDANWAQGT